METLLRNLKIDPSMVRIAYQLNRAQGRQVLKQALIAPGIRKSELEAAAKRNNDDPAEIIRKRDAMLDAIIDFVEEALNLDND